VSRKFLNQNFNFENSFSGQCGFNGTATLLEKNFTSPNWPGVYSNYLSCEWFFTTDPGSRIEIDVKSFETEGRFDIMVGRTFKCRTGTRIKLFNLSKMFIKIQNECQNDFSKSPQIRDILGAAKTNNKI